MEALGGPAFIRPAFILHAYVPSIFDHVFISLVISRMILGNKLHFQEISTYCCHDERKKKVLFFHISFIGVRSYAICHHRVPWRRPGPLLSYR